MYALCCRLARRNNGTRPTCLARFNRIATIMIVGNNIGKSMRAEGATSSLRSGQKLDEIGKELARKVDYKLLIPETPDIMPSQDAICVDGAMLSRYETQLVSATKYLG